ncbi:hypothetical protein PPERSA_06924 [Pseudocohnilembus persalinus]|uniref:Uncharacterized protein n=1 Tax=Pseudocohnilembus persalinus TaxID=266149 RepID=A0A0V0QZ20_PSEPJ|nr:hypothetical protein PPERSA_06924 [Pseudocohnilembus persalinus]|eukprot:KRX07309.1 hypothetical protein PPERSA_06924 [Pseudocohnilembus persalinus]
MNNKKEIQIIQNFDYSFTNNTQLLYNHYLQIYQWAKLIEYIQEQDDSINIDTSSESEEDNNSIILSTKQNKKQNAQQDQIQNKILQQSQSLTDIQSHDLEYNNNNDDLRQSDIKKCNSHNSNLHQNKQNQPQNIQEEEKESEEENALCYQKNLTQQQLSNSLIQNEQIQQQKQYLKSLSVKLNPQQKSEFENKQAYLKNQNYQVIQEEVCSDKQAQKPSLTKFKNSLSSSDYLSQKSESQNFSQKNKLDTKKTQNNQNILMNFLKINSGVEDSDYNLNFSLQKKENNGLKDKSLKRQKQNVKESKQNMLEKTEDPQISLFSLLTDAIMKYTEKKKYKNQQIQRKKELKQKKIQMQQLSQKKKFSQLLTQTNINLKGNQIDKDNKNNFNNNNNNYNNQNE